MLKKNITYLIGGILILTSLASCKQKEMIYNPSRDKGLYILTPKVSDSPHINGPSVFRERPGSPFLYSIPATGVRPLIFRVEGLPTGLTVDGKSGIITGIITDKSKKEYSVKLVATNNKGETSKKLKIIVGNEICLTPPLGWNAWNSWRNIISQDKVLASARAMVTSGLQQYGWTYIIF